MLCGLLGQKLGHSYSPQIHAALADYDYRLFEVEPEDLAGFLNRTPFQGLNVTIPYKKAVLPYCAGLSEAARAMGSVNTLVRQKDGTLWGDNTDWVGFCAILDSLAIPVQGKKALVLGSGGAGVMAAWVLQNRGAQVITVSRGGPDNYENLDRHRDAALLVNATPVGMYPHTEGCPVDPGQFPRLEGVLDLIYNPAGTRLLLRARDLGIPCRNGLRMLVGQAKRAAELFTGQSLEDALTQEITARLAWQTANVILIGMPGSGKTTVGQALARRLGRDFADGDQAVEEATGQTIPQIFQTGGEAAFRQEETKVLSRLGKASGLVIATGGGCVTRPENRDLLRQNGIVIFLERPLDRLSREGRPLSLGADLEAMYRRRLPLYRQFADATVKNTGCPEETAAVIEEVSYEISRMQWAQSESVGHP